MGSGYTTNTKCSKWPKEGCSVSKKPVTKYTPITGCTKEPIELCAPAGCGFTQGDEVCYDKTQTVVQDVPKEVCTRSRTNPRPVKKPVVKKWCYVPTEESGLAQDVKSALSIQEHESFTAMKVV